MYLITKINYKHIFKLQFLTITQNQKSLLLSFDDFYFDTFMYDTYFALIPISFSLKCYWHIIL